ncbi:MAG: universal stress protein [Gemmatimonadales bacterium]
MAWKPIVVAVDGSPESVRAAVTGSMIAEKAGAECVIVHAVPDYLASFTAPDVQMDVAGLEDLAMEHAREFISGTLKGDVRPEVLAGLRAEVGRAPIVIQDAVRKLDAQLLVLGGKHHRGLDRIGGSTVTHMARTIDIPMLVTDGGSPTITKVLAAVDVSYASEPTIAEAEKFAKMFGAKLRVMHVVEPVPIIPGVPITVGDEDYFRGESRVLESNVWPKVSVPGAETVIRRGRAASSIADEVVQWGADLLVLGSHGKGWVDRLLIGSTSERLLRILPTLTMVVPVARPPHKSLGDMALPWESAAVAGGRART